MLRRESQLRNAEETQRWLDDLKRKHKQQRRWPDSDFDDNEGDHADAQGDEKQYETMKAKERIAALWAQRQQVNEGIGSLRGASCEKEIFEGIKARVVREFGLGSEYVDVLYSAVSRFPGDADIVASANCELHPRFDGILILAATLTLRCYHRPQVQPRETGIHGGRRHRVAG